jgi:flagellin
MQMSSILTNNSAMVALQTLQSINKNLATTQTEISTGKSVSSAKDDSAVWAISKVMESDVQGFKTISDSLSLGESTVAVAQNAAETVTDLLTQMKGKIVAAQEGNVDRGKLNTDVTALKDQINSVVSSAQFNGLNLVDGSAANATILSSLDRDSAGNVTSSSITVSAQDLSTSGYTAKAAFGAMTGVSATNDSFGFSLDASDGAPAGTDTGTVIIDDPTYAEGDRINMTLGDVDVSYTVTADDVASTSTGDVVALGLKTAIEASGADVSVNYDSTNAGQLVIENNSANSLSISGQFQNKGSGGLAAMAGIDVSTANGATSGLAAIEALIDTAIGAAASFGSAQGRIETQSDFVSKLSDSLKTGIGSMVDADMEEVSARLQALQTQQQLGVQSLSIANQAPQTILSLFR